MTNTSARWLVGLYLAVFGGVAAATSVVPSTGGTYSPDAVITPSNGDYWIYGTSESITWSTRDIAGRTVNLYVLHDNPAEIFSPGAISVPSPQYVNSAYWYLFASDVPNTGSYTVDPASLNGQGNAYIVLVVSDEGYWDISEGMFTLAPDSGSSGDTGGNDEIIPCDLNGDGSFSRSDLRAMIQLCRSWGGHVYTPIYDFDCDIDEDERFGRSDLLSYLATCQAQSTRRMVIEATSVPLNE